MAHALLPLSHACPSLSGEGPRPSTCIPNAHVQDQWHLLSSFLG